MKQLEQFYTKQASETGLKIDLTNANGDPTDFHLTIYGIDSDAFKFAKSEARAETIAAMDETDKQTMFETTNRINIKLLASLVKDWNFTNPDGSAYPCTQDNVIDFLTEAPQIAEKIDNLTVDRSLFIRSESHSSAKQQVKGSHSKKQLKARK